MSALHELAELMRDTDTRDEDVVLGLENQIVRVLDKHGKWKTLSPRKVHFIKRDAASKQWHGAIPHRNRGGEFEWVAVSFNSEDVKWRPVL